jgi:hypothetical protein
MDENLNRRKFFGMTALAVAAAGLPALVLPEKTIFLPPRYGWKPAQLGDGYMRELSQYVINVDEMHYRYDAIGRDIWGKEYQFHVTTKKPLVEIARHLIADRFKHDGLIAIPPARATEFRLAIPPTVATGRYV